MRTASTCAFIVTRSATLTITTAENIVNIIIYKLLGPLTEACLSQRLRPSTAQLDTCIRQTLTTKLLIISAFSQTAPMSRLLIQSKLSS